MVQESKTLTPAFHYSILKNYAYLILSSKWQKHAKNGEPVRVFQDISSMSLDTILQCAFSFKSNCQLDGERHPYADCMLLALYTAPKGFLIRFTNTIGFTGEQLMEER